MSVEQQTPEQDRSGERRRKATKAAGYVLAFGAIALPSGGLFLSQDREEIVVAGHEAEVSPTRDGYATIETGALSIEARTPAHMPFGTGVNIKLGRTVATNYDELLQRYAAILSQPSGEIANVEDMWRGMVYENALKGIGVSVAALSIWSAIGSQRRRHLIDKMIESSKKQRTTAMAGAVLVAGGTAGFSTLQNDDSYVPPDQEWTSLRDQFPEIPDDPIFNTVKIDNGPLTKGAKKMIRSFINIYEESEAFYSSLEDKVADLTPQLRQPKEGETAVLVVTDRHDNIGMDPVARKVGDVVGAKVVVDLGDTTGSGSKWEEFSMNSEIEAFKDYKNIIAPGNHDNGDTVGNFFKDHGWAVVSGKEITVDGIRFLGNRDPRSSGLGHWRNTAQGTIPEMGEQLAETACEANEKGNRIPTIIVHDGNAGSEALARGCVDLVLSGHTHRQIGPITSEGENGQAGTALTIGSTGGATLPVAFGSKLRRDAQVAVVTYKEGRPVGVQVVDFTTGGNVTAQDYAEIKTGPVVQETRPQIR